VSDDVRRLAPDTDSLARRIPYGTPAGTLCVLGPEGGVQVVPGTPHLVTFGRAAADVDVALGVEDPAVSRLHGRIAHDGRKWRLTNTGNLPIRFPGSDLLLQHQDEPLSRGYTPLFIKTDAGEHVLEVLVTARETPRARPRPDGSAPLLTTIADRQRAEPQPDHRPAREGGPHPAGPPPPRRRGLTGVERRPSHDAVTWDPRNTNGPSGDEPGNAQSQAGAVIGSGALVDGRYRLESIIGAGGMGVVWAATHERLDRKVALKQIPLVVPGGEPAERIRARTLREARITASLNEVDGVVRIANYFDDEHNVWLELEYLDALNLAELIQATGGLPPAEVAWIGARVARALAGGHELEPPVQHRDIKPGNVLVSRDGAAVKLSDYGISRRDGDPAVTMIGAIHATLPYAAPEVVREHFTTVESDIWSLGATLYHAVEGRLPYGDHDSNQSLIEAVRAADIQPMERAGPQLGPILERMLVVNPASRIDADTAAEKLERIAAPLGAQTSMHLSH
jgi:hypothetical protein